jgi:hypothetical protein
VHRKRGARRHDRGGDGTVRVLRQLVPNDGTTTRVARTMGRELDDPVLLLGPKVAGGCRGSRNETDRMTLEQPAVAPYAASRAKISNESAMSRARSGPPLREVTRGSARPDPAVAVPRGGYSRLSPSLGRRPPRYSSVAKRPLSTPM